MRARRLAATTVAATTAVALLGVGLAGGIAAADDSVPSKSDVRAARTEVRAQADDVDSVRARLAVANQRLQASAVVAAQAAEAFNGARYHADQARAAAADAQVATAAAQAEVERQREAYTDSIVTSYELAPGLTALSAVVHSDGIDAVLQRSATMENAEDALDGNYDELRATAVVADVARDRAERAEATAERAEQDALEAKEAARRAADDAAADAQTIAAEKAALIARLARLEHVSVRLAQRRQSALEARAARAAAAAAAAAAEREQAQAQAAKDAEPTESPTVQRTATPTPEPTGTPTVEPDPEPTTEPTTESTTEPTTEPAAPPATAPAPKSGAQAAIAFARAQIGEPYRWGAAGPSSWDCSGLTSGAWQAGGTSLPHYSVAQYEQSTPISASQLQPGDLVFWGSSSDPGSIYHVALYAGGGKIIEAPRTGVPVREVSIYAWIAPNFYARP